MKLTILTSMWWVTCGGHGEGTAASVSCGSGCPSVKVRFDTTVGCCCTFAGHSSDWSANWWQDVHNFVTQLYPIIYTDVIQVYSYWQMECNDTATLDILMLLWVAFRCVSACNYNSANILFNDFGIVLGILYLFWHYYLIRAWTSEQTIEIVGLQEGCHTNGYISQSYRTHLTGMFWGC